MSAVRRIVVTATLAASALPSTLGAVVPQRHPDLGSGVIASTRPGSRGGERVWERVGTTQGVWPENTVTDVTVDLEADAYGTVQVVLALGRNDGSELYYYTLDLEPAERRTITLQRSQFLSLTLLSEDENATLRYRIVRIDRNS
jgi:hypothetical protein